MFQLPVENTGRSEIVTTMRVMVTSAKSRIAYNVVRSLGQKGIEVYTADFISRAMCFASRYSHGHICYPSPFRDQEEFINTLIKAVKHFKIDVLIPVFEETFLLARYKLRMLEHVRMVLPDYEQILLAHNKDQWASRAEQIGIPIPRSYSIDSIRKNIINSNDFNCPVLIKPKQGGGAWGISHIDSFEMLKKTIRKPLYDSYEWDRFFVQEKIDGETLCVAMFFSNGKLRAKVAYRQLRDYPVTGGQATLRVSVRNEVAETYLQRLLEDMNWHGVCQADFIVDRKSRVPHLIDINPRLWGSIAQAIASGVDFPYLIYKTAVDGDVTPVKVFKTGIKTRWIGGELGSFISLLKNTRQKISFLHDYFTSKDNIALYDDFCMRDPVPFLLWSFDTVSKMLRSRSMAPVSHDSLDGIWE